MVLTARARRTLALLLTALLLSPGLLGVLQGRREVRRGVNDAGGEWSDGRQAAEARTDPYSSAATPRWLGERGIRLVRLPFRWERLQPTPGGDLDAAEVGYLRRYLGDAAAHHVQVIVEPHNGARYALADGRTVRIGEVGCSITQFADFWQRMARALGDAPGLLGYGLMNEPANMPTETWKAASQRALDAIRATGDSHLVLVPGNNYASAHIWTMCHGRRGWIDDPARNFAYEAHVYLDGEGSGAYRHSFETERQADPDILERGPRRVRIFLDWCRDNNVRGFIGEVGAPPDAGWLEALDRTLACLDRAHVDATLWAAGERWPDDYKMNMQPLPGGADRPQTTVLLRHLGGATGSLAHDFCGGYLALWGRTRLWLAGLKQSATQFVPHP